MKVSKNNKQKNTLTNFFTKVSKEVSSKSGPSNSNNIHTNDNVIAEINLACDPLKDNSRSPLKRRNSNELTADFKRKKVDSPTKGSPKHVKQKTIEDFNFNDLDDDFFQDFDENGFLANNLDLTKIQRYKVEGIEITNSNDIKLTVESTDFHNRGMCTVRSPWNACSIQVGDVVGLRGRKGTLNENSHWIIDWEGGVLVTNPDNLISGTTVVNSLYCPRKTVLSSIFKEEGNSRNTIMFVGCLVHELLQEVLTSKTTSLQDIENIFTKIKHSKDFRLQVFMNNYNYEEVVEDISYFIPKIYDFVVKYVNHGRPSQFVQPRHHQDKFNSDWCGEIVGVRDIEENIWCYNLGLKGKIDATVEVKVGNRVKTVPLELKTGKVSPLSLEHRGQVILYCMMLKELGENVDSGLLLYLRDEGKMLDVNCGDKESRDLILLRNGLSTWLKNLSLVDPAPAIAPPQLPKVINRSSCQSCSQLVACSSALRHSGELQHLKESHVLKNLGKDSTNHLTEQHLQYIFHWIGLLTLEFQMTKFNISRIWSVKPETSQLQSNDLDQIWYRCSLCNM